MKKTTFIVTVWILLLLSCKEESVNFSELSNDDALIINEIMTNNLLYNMTYTLVDSVSKNLIFSKVQVQEEQKILIDKLIKKDSIPDLKYSVKNHLNMKTLSHGTHSITSINTYNEIFRDPYFVSGKINNYKVLKEKTGNDGLIFISNLYYSENNTEAIVGVAMHCGWNCGQIQVRYYKKENHQWKMQMNYIISEN